MRNEDNNNKNNEKSIGQNSFNLRNINLNNGINTIDFSQNILYSNNIMRQGNKDFQNNKNMSSEVKFADLLTQERIEQKSPKSANTTMNNTTKNIIEELDSTWFRMQMIDNQIHTLCGLKNLVSETYYDCPSTETFQKCEKQINESQSTDFDALIEFIDELLAEKLKTLLGRWLKVIDSDHQMMIDRGLPYWKSLSECKVFREDFYFERAVELAEERKNKKHSKSSNSSRKSKVYQPRLDGIAHNVAMKKLKVNFSEYTAYRRHGMEMKSIEADAEFISKMVLKRINRSRDFGEYEKQKDFADATGLTTGCITYWIQRGAPVNQGIQAFEDYRNNYVSRGYNTYGELTCEEWSEYLDVPIKQIRKANAVVEGFFLRSVEEIESDIARCYRKNAGFQYSPDPLDEKITLFVDAIENGENSQGMSFEWEQDQRAVA